ncbi:unnamed protein product [[Actinomadura] parvosata subsp. kistnae]|nr:unnamed protein product [Actinomadura parvosata subsp. kistnae]
MTAPDNVREPDIENLTAPDDGARACPHRRGWPGARGRWAAIAGRATVPAARMALLGRSSAGSGCRSPGRG